MKYKTITKCRICGGGDLKHVIDLGEQPLANNLLSNPEEQVDLYPLVLMQCQACSLLQLTAVVNPEEMFTNYPFRSGISQFWQEHCKKLAGDTAINGGKMVDIGSNDGTLLECYKKYGMEVLGVDPSNLANESNTKRLQTLKDYWSTEIADKYGFWDIITALNVMAHTDNLDEFAQAVNIGLKPNGKCIIEVPYAANMIKNLQFDAIYHEHLSYFTVEPLRELSAKWGLFIAEIEMVETHGGSLRIILTKTPPCPLEKVVFIAPEINSNDLSNLESRIKDHYEQLITVLQELSPFASLLYCGYGASAKAATFFNSKQCPDELKQGLKFIVDDNADKQHRYISGVNSKIHSIDIFAKQPEWMPIVIFSWNIAESLVKKLREDLGYKNPIIYKGENGDWIVKQ